MHRHCTPNSYCSQSLNEGGEVYPQNPLPLVTAVLNVRKCPYQCLVFGLTNDESSISRILLVNHRNSDIQHTLLYIRIALNHH